jgi:hypothetical protein
MRELKRAARGIHSLRPRNVTASTPTRQNFRYAARLSASA